MQNCASLPPMKPRLQSQYSGMALVDETTGQRGDPAQAKHTNGLFWCDGAKGEPTTKEGKDLHPRCQTPTGERRLKRSDLNGKITAKITANNSTLFFFCFSAPFSFVSPARCNPTSFLALPSFCSFVSSSLQASLKAPRQC